MQCYVCKQNGVDREAVGVCIVCGMGLCSEHMVRSDVEIREGGYPFPSRKLKTAVPRILCPECAKVFGGR